MRRIGCTETVAVVRHVLTEVVGEVVAALVALAAGGIRPPHDTVPDLEWEPLKVAVLAVSAYGRNRSHILVTLNDGETDLLSFAGSRVLRGETLVCVLVCTADAG